MKNIFIFILTISLPFQMALSDDVLKNHILDNKKDGLDRIIKKRYIRILTTKNAFDYFIYQGATRGIQLEMAKRFTLFLNKKFPSKKNTPKIVFELIPVDYDQLIPMLLAGQGDIIASGMSITEKRKKRVQFSTPYRKIDEVILINKKNKFKKWKEMTFHVRKSSSYFEALNNYTEELKIKNVSESLHTENIMELVSIGKYEMTLVDSYLAESAIKVFPNLIKLKEREFGRNLPIAWAVRQRNVELLQVINDFMPSIKKGTMLGNILSNKYFKNMGKIKSKNFNAKTSTISRYDKTIKKYSKEFGFDWRLMAALCYQESRFRAHINNKWGAIGLFQIKQMTANEPYINIKEIKGIKNYKNNIHAGIKYLSWIKKRYFDPKQNMRERDRIRMTIAAYNAGPARVLKAITATKKMGLNPNKWFRNVELGMLSLKKEEPVLYMSEINKRYVSYILLGIKK